jgi:hypothetical protein
VLILATGVQAVSRDREELKTGKNGRKGDREEVKKGTNGRQGRFFELIVLKLANIDFIRLLCNSKCFLWIANTRQINL